MDEIITTLTEELYPTAREVLNNVDALNPSSFPSPEQMGARIFTGNFARMGRLARAIIALALRELVWKAIAMRKAGRNNQLWWFVCILIFNTVGILPILYILFGQKKKD